MAKFMIRKKTVDGHRVFIAPNFSWNSSNDNTGIPAPDVHVQSAGDRARGVITIEFHAGGLETLDFARLYDRKFAKWLETNEVASIAKIVEARIMKHREFGRRGEGGFIGTASDVLVEETQASQATLEASQWLEQSARLQELGVSHEDAMGMMQGLQEALAHGESIEDVLLAMKRGRVPVETVSPGRGGNGRPARSRKKVVA